MNRALLQIASIALALGAQARAAELPLPQDGWAGWQVEAVEDAPAWCCWDSWDDRVAQTKACNLDGDRQGFGTRGQAKTDAARVYAHFTSGKLDGLRTLAAACPVETKTPIQKLDIATVDSTRWLIGLTSRNDLHDDVLASLALHRGDVAFEALNTLARRDSNPETRKHAIFWLAEMRGIPGAAVDTDVMFNDPDKDIRKHAAFAVTQSKSPTAAADLTRLGNTDKDGDVRAQAWFWLAHTGAPNAERAITAAFKKDQDEHVREQAVFALSQLPEERATPALIATVEDRSLTHEQRKRALFWLAQSKAPAAQTYLEKVLEGNTAR